MHLNEVNGAPHSGVLQELARPSANTKQQNGHGWQGEGNFFSVRVHELRAIKTNRPAILGSLAGAVRFRVARRRPSVSQLFVQ